MLKNDPILPRHKESPLLCWLFAWVSAVQQLWLRRRKHSACQNTHTNSKDCIGRLNVFNLQTDIEMFLIVDFTKTKCVALQI